MTHADSTLGMLGRSRDTGAGAALPPRPASTRPPAPRLHVLDIRVYGVSAVDGSRYELPLAPAGPAPAGCPVEGCTCEEL